MNLDDLGSGRGFRIGIGLGVFRDVGSGLVLRYYKVLIYINILYNQYMSKCPNMLGYSLFV